MAGEVDDLLARHRVLTGPAAEADRFAERLSVVHASRGEAQAHLLVRTNGSTDPLPPGWETHPVSLEELTLAYLREPGRGGAARPGPRPGRRTVGGDEMTTLTVLTVPAGPEEDASLRPVPWRRMAWVIWRQHRIALGGVAAALGALAVYVWIVGLHCTTPTPPRPPATRPVRLPALT